MTSKILKKPGTVELKIWNMAYREEREFHSLLDAQITSLSADIRKSDFPWNDKKVKDYFLERVKPFQQVVEEQIALSFHMHDTIYYREEMSGSRFAQVSSGIPVIWDECKVQYEVRKDGEEDYQAIKVLPVERHLGEFSRFMRKQITDLIDMPEDFDDPKQSDRYYKKLKARYHILI